MATSKRVHSYLKQIFQMRRGSARATTRIIGRLHNFSSSLSPLCFSLRVFVVIFLLPSVWFFSQHFFFISARTILLIIAFPERFVFMILASHITLSFLHTHLKSFVQVFMLVCMLKEFYECGGNISSAFLMQKEEHKNCSAAVGSEKHERGHVYRYRSFFFSR